MSRLRSPLVIAHRGASGTLPENTLPAYELAVAQGADMIEIDLHRTRDRETIVTHDEDLARFGLRGEIADVDAAEIRGLDAGGGAVIPTLDEVLAAFGSRVPFNLELKRGRRQRYDDLETAALEAVERRGLLASTLFSSFDDPTLAELRSQSAEARVALLLSARSAERAIERAQAVGAEAVNPSRLVVTPELVADAHRAGLAVYVYTVDAEDEMRRLIGLGVDGLFTNFPARMRSVLGTPREVDLGPNN